MSHDNDDDAVKDRLPRKSGQPTGTEPPVPRLEGSEDEEASAPSERVELPGGVQLDDLMRRAFDAEEPEPHSVDVLRGVQWRLRQRSKGKFYRDGWSTTQHPPFSTFFVTSLMMIAIVAILYAIIVPLVGDPVELPKEPKPIQLLPP